MWYIIKLENFVDEHIKCDNDAENRLYIFSTLASEIQMC